MNNVVSINNATADSALDVRTRIAELMGSTAALPASQRYSQARIAKESGVSSSAVSQYLSGTYAGDTDAVEAKLARWLDAEQEKRSADAMMPVAPGYVPTPTSEKVIGALRYAQTAQDIAVIYGGAGLGKTSGIKRYVALMPQVWHITMTPASASVVTALQEIAEVVGSSTGGGAAALHRGICKRIVDTGGLLVIDEAQHLSVAALDQIRSIHDATEIGIALVGNDAVYARMTGGNRAAYLDRLYSRIGRKVRLPRAVKDDVHAIIEAWAIADAKCRAQLEDIASKPGAIRTLTKVLRLAAMYAAAQGRALCCDDVRTAWRELGGAE